MDDTRHAAFAALRCGRGNQNIHLNCPSLPADEEVMQCQRAQPASHQAIGFHKWERHRVSPWEGHLMHCSIRIKDFPSRLAEKTPDLGEHVTAVQRLSEIRWLLSGSQNPIYLIKSHEVRIVRRGEIQ